MAEKESAKQQGELRKPKAYCQTNAQQQRSGVSRTQDVTVLSGTRHFVQQQQDKQFQGSAFKFFFWLPGSFMQIFAPQTQAVN